MSFSFRGISGTLAVNAAGYVRLHSAVGITDAYIVLESSEDTGVEWSVPTDFITSAIQREGELHLALAATLPEPLNPATTEAQFAAAMKARAVLSGDVELCRLLPGRSAGVISARTVSALPLKAPEGLEVNSKAGELEIGWPVRLQADYDQNGEVNIADLTPLGVLYGQRRGNTPHWLLEAHRRVDGDGNGEINIADLTPLGGQLGETLGSYNLERSVGSASGPAAWEPYLLGIEPVNSTRYGYDVKPMGGAPYRRVLAPVEPGFAYFRLTYVKPDGTLSPPGEPALAPDLTAPIWTVPADLAFSETDSSNHVLEWQSSGLDDRSGPMEYEIVINTGSGADVAQLPLAARLQGGVTVQGDVASPFDFTGLIVPNQPELAPYSYDFHIGYQYHFRVAAVDEAGNRTWSEPLSHTVNFGRSQTPDDLDVDASAIWIARDGSVKLDPPQISGVTNGEVELYYYTLIETLGLQSNPNGSEDFDPLSRQPHPGGELVFPQALNRSEIFYICLEVVDPSRTLTRDKVLSITFRNGWLEPFEGQHAAGDYRFDHTYYADDGTPLFFNALLPEIYSLRGGAYFREDFSGVGFEPGYTNTPIKRHPVVADLLFHNPHLAGTGTVVTWWKQGQGKAGQFTIPEAVMKPSFGNPNTVLEWEYVSADRVQGVRGVNQPQPGGGLGIELWQGARNGSFELAEVLRPPGLDSTDVNRKVILNQGKLVVQQSINPQFLEPEKIRLLVRTGVDDWSRFDTWLHPPAEFNPAGWGRWHVDRLTPGEPESYAILRGVDDPTKDTAQQVAYFGLYRGDLTQGLAGFTKVMELRSDTAPDATYPHLSRLELVDFHPAIPGKLLAYHFEPTGNALYIILSLAGKIERVIDPRDYSGMTYFHNGQLMHGLLSGSVSADGQWMRYDPASELWGLGVENLD
jgi:hypothetical protein